MTPADTLLVLRAQQGDRAALDAALQSIQRPLFGYIARLVARSGVAAEDVLQETLLRIARNLRWLKEARYFRTWAFRIASREAFRALGRSRSAPPTEELDERQLFVVVEDDDGLARSWCSASSPSARTSRGRCCGCCKRSTRVK